MTGRRLCSDLEATARGFGGRDCAQRRRVLRETIATFETCQPPDHFHRLAFDNLRRWRGLAVKAGTESRTSVVKGDWGEVAGALTKEYGTCFAVLNMANAYIPGGAYVEGAIAQEENMYRRTNCHFHIDADQYDEERDRYVPAMTELLSAKDGTVYLDKAHARICIRGAEDRTAQDLGYPWLADEEIFPFYELRAAARDLRDGSEFDAHDARRRIAAQLDTLRLNGIRHAVLGAFGCGAFRNPAENVARLYREEIAARREHFDVVAFAIFSAGYGPDNYGPFAEVFATA